MSLEFDIETHVDLSLWYSIDATVHKDVEKGLWKSAYAIEARAKVNAQSNLNTSGEATGRLANSIISIVFPSQLKAEIGPTVVYGRQKELGGMIEARSAAFMTFQLPSGEWRRCTSVNQKPQPYLEPALTDTIPEIDNFILQPIRDAIP